MPSYNFYSSTGKAAFQFLSAAAFAGLSFQSAIPTASAALEETWSSQVNANWSTESVWIDGSAPAAGGDPALILRFLKSGLSNAVALNDLGGTFKANQLFLDNSESGILTVGSVAPGSIEMTGTNPLISSEGANLVTLSSALLLNPIDGNSITLGGSGTGNLTLSGVITESGGSRSLLVKGTAPSVNTQTITLVGNNTFTGGVTLESGNLSLSGSAPLGSGALTVNGGTLRLAGGTIANPIVLNADLLIQSPGNTTLSGIISSAVPGTGLIIRDSTLSLTLTKASTYNGATTLDYSLAASRAASKSTDATGSLLRLSGNGSILNSAAINVDESQLQIDGVLSGTLNRIGDTAPVNLRSGQLTLTGVAGGVAQNEIIGALTGAGYSVITLAGNFPNLPKLTASTLSRVERGTFLFRALSMNSGTGSKMLFTTAPAGLVGGGGNANTLDISILPYAMGDLQNVGFGSDLVTYDVTNGMRLLNSFEYAAALGTATNNVRLTSATSIQANVTANALVLDGGSLNGIGSITLTSGALLQKSGAGISNPLVFGAAEANVFAQANMALSGVVSGTNGFTKSGDGKLILSANNSFSGTLTINAGLVGFGSLSNLGPDTSAILINGTHAGLSYNGANPLTLSRNLETRTGIALLEAVGNGDLTLSGTITGQGGIRINSNDGRRVILAGANGFTGPTLVSSGTLQIASEAALGNGGGVDLAGGTLQLNGDWTTNREVSVTFTTATAASTIDTGTHAAILNGLLIGNGALRKNGPGVLRLSGEQPYAGPLTINGGRIELAGNASTSLISKYTLNPGTALVLDNSVVAKTNRLGSASSLTVIGGEIRLIGNALTPVVETLGSLVLGTGGTGTILTVNSVGNVSTTLQIKAIAYGGGDFLLRSADLGGSARILLPAGFVPAGVVPRFYADTDPNGIGSSFVLYDPSSDASGTIGFRPLGIADYSTGSTIANPANGGAIPTSANFLASGVTSATGVSNTISTLTIDAGGGIVLGTGQTLAISSGNLLARAGATSIAGGTLDFGPVAGTLYTAGNFELASKVSSSAGFIKTGPGTLTFNGLAAYSGYTIIANGRLRSGTGDPFVAQTMTVARRGIWDLNNSASSAGAIAGEGEIAIGSGTLTAGGVGTDFVFSGMVSGTGKLALVNGGNPLATRTLSGVNTLSGTIELNSGRLVIGSSEALGTATLVVNGGSLQVNPAFTLKNALVLNSDLPFAGTNALTFGPGASLSGPGTFTVRGVGGLNIGTPLAMTAALRSAPGGVTELIATPGTITLNGAFGSVSTPVGLHIERGTLTLDNTTAFAGPASDRIGDTTTVELRGGALLLKGNASVSTAETIGKLTGAGYSSISFSGSGIELTASAIERLERGTFLFANNTLSGQKTNFFLTTPVSGLVGGGGTGPDTSILPYATGNYFTSSSDVVDSLVTYDPVIGIRSLSDTDYSANLLAGATKNVSLPVGSTQAVAGSVVVNALRIEAAASITGTGSLKIGSGVILARPSATTVSSIASRLVFDNAEASFFLPSGAVLQADGVIEGSGGLTVSGTGILQLNAASTFTGPITVNNANLAYSSPGNLGSDTVPIVLHNGALRSLSPGNLTLNRDLQLNSGISILATSTAFSFAASAATFSVPSTLSGPGGLGIEGNGYVILSGTNTYQGPTKVAGKLAIASDAALGSGNLVQLLGAPALLRLNGPWITGKNIEIVGIPTIDTNGFDATINGQLARSAASSNAGLIKTGAGRLILTTSSPFNGSLTLDGGTLVLTGNGSVASSAVVVSNDSTLVLDNSTVSKERLYPFNATVTLNNGNLRVLGNAGANSQVELAMILGDPATHSAITLTAPGPFGTTLLIHNLFLDHGRALLRGDNLGGAPGTAYTRITSDNLSTLSGNLIPGAVADSSIAGTGSSFAFYDKTSDAAGVIGVRTLRPDDFASTSAIQNASNGGVTPVAANFLVRNATTLVGTNNTLNSLTFAQGGSIALNEGQTLTLSKAGIFTPAGVDATLSGGTLAGLGYLLGDGNLTISSKVDGIPTLVSGGFPSLVKTGSGRLTFNGQLQSPSATLTVDGGTLRVGPDNPLLYVKLRMSTGTVLDLDNGSTRIAQLSGSGNVQLGTGTLSTAAGDFSGSISGGGGLAAAGSGTLTLLGNNTFTGPTSVNGMLLTLSENGTVAGTSALSASGFGYIRFDNTGSLLSRIGTVPVSLNQATFELIGNLVDSSVQSFGPLTVRGTSTLAINAADLRKPTQLSFASLNRVDHATLEFRAAEDNRATTADPRLGVGQAKIVFQTAPGQLVGANTRATNRPILPFAFSATLPAGLITYDSQTGIRPLDVATEYSPVLSAGDNVRLSTGVSNDASLTINSLSLGASINGTGTLTVTSGTVLSYLYSGDIRNSLNFGSAEAVIYAYGNLTVSALAGSGGLTKTGVGTLALTGPNTITGPLTINQGTFSVPDPTYLGPDNSPILLNHGRLLVNVAANSTTVFSRPIQLNGALGSITGGEGTLRIDTPIIGEGGLEIAGNVIFNTINAYTGVTRISSRLSIGSDAVFGTTSGIELAGTLALTAPWITERSIDVLSPSKIDTAGTNAELRGSLSGLGTLEKTGAGRLTIHNAENFFGTLSVTGGILEVAGTMHPSAVTAANGTTLTGNGTFAGPVTVNGTLAPGNGIGILSIGSLLLSENAILSIELGSPMSFDQLIVTGSVNLSGPVNLSLALAPGYHPTPFVDAFPILLNDDADAIAGTGRFTIGGVTLDQGSRFTVDGNEFAFSYSGGDGNDAVIYSVPEPAQSALLFFGSLALSLMRPRRQRHARV